jgi:hypothetical protein
MSSPIKKQNKPSKRIKTLLARVFILLLLLNVNNEGRGVNIKRPIYCRNALMNLEVIAVIEVTGRVSHLFCTDIYAK